MHAQTHADARSHTQTLTYNTNNTNYGIRESRNALSTNSAISPHSNQLQRSMKCLYNIHTHTNTDAQKYTHYTCTHVYILTYIPHTQTYIHTIPFSPTYIHISLKYCDANTLIYN